ncbi:MAG: hypothetical protein LAN64_17030 [Acidobacteriia bacterium]|nr:hypothetical protein [Terriglobia bacterium]
MRRILVLLAVFALLACPAIVWAQAEEMHGPPKILEIIREDSKPGKTTAHRKHEAMWIQAVVKADPKIPHMLTISSVTGPDEDWFMMGFDNFAQFEKSNEAFESNAALAQVMATYSAKETDFVSESRTVVARYRPELSYKPEFTLGEYKYFNVLIVRYKLGSSPEGVHKIVQAAREKANPNYHQVTYEVTSGMPVGTYLYFTPIKSLATWDEPPNKAYSEALKEGHFMEEVGKTVQFVDSRLFAFSPRMSYVSEEVAKADPSFWHPKTEMAKAPAVKAATPAAKKEMKTEKQ